MQNTKPEKVLGKKFVRGKPYYRIKWEGSRKDQSSWEPPANLRKYKSMINKYEIKNWGVALDDKFFDPELYKTKAFISSKKTTDKKTAKKQKQIQKKKIQQPQSEQSQSISQETSSSSQQSGDEKNKKKYQFQQKIPKSTKKLNKKQKVVSETQQLEIIDLEPQIAKNKMESLQKNQTQPQSQSQVEVEKQKQPKQVEIQHKQKECVPIEKKKGQASSIINIQQMDRNSKKQKEQLINGLSIDSNQQQYHRDLGLCLTNTPEQPNKEAQILQWRNTERTASANPAKHPLSVTSVVRMHIQPTKSIAQIVHIHHLSKLNVANHMYLVEYNDGQMKKMKTSDLLERHAEDFVAFLESNFRNKCKI